MYRPQSEYPGGFSTQDGTIDFYLRIQSFLHKEMTVLDLGAGRGAWYEDDDSVVRQWVRDIRPRVKELIGADTDPIVLTNRSTTRNVLIEDNLIPVADNSIDIIISDFVLEHISNPDAFIWEISRVLKPNGVFCARTPHYWNYVSVAARLIRSTSHQSALRRIQPQRKEVDVFPTEYRLNSARQVRNAFGGWDCSIMIYRTEPGYYFGSKAVYHILRAAHHILPSKLVGNMFIFCTKRS